MVTPDFIASPDSVLGKLQRGRGAGYREVLLLPKQEAEELLFECITNDPRMDFQIESRNHYYASILMELRLSPKKLLDYLKLQNGSELAHRLTVSVLTELAKYNYEDSQRLLFDYLQWGGKWDSVVNDLCQLNDNDLNVRLVQLIEQRFTSEEDRVKAFDSLWSDTTKTLSSLSPALKAYLSKKPYHVDAASSLPGLDSLSIQELLKLAERNTPLPVFKRMKAIVKPEDLDFLMSHVSLESIPRAALALVGIRKIGSPEVLDKLVKFWLSIPAASDLNRNMAGSVSLLKNQTSWAIVDLGAETTLPLARAWIFSRNCRKHELADRILQTHANWEDLPILKKALKIMLEDEEEEWGCFFIKNFKDFPNLGVEPDLLKIYRRFRFSFGRGYAVDSIQVTSPDYFNDHLAEECLWDCEPGIRETAATYVPLISQDIIARLHTLAHDPFEEEEVRAAALRRISNP